MTAYVVPWDRMDGPRPPISFPGNGCTGVSNRVAGRLVKPACDIHDWEYHAAVKGVVAEVQADLPSEPVSIRWEGEGCYVPLHGTWRFYGETKPTRLDADWRFARNTSVLLRYQGIPDAYATFVGIRRFLGVRLFGKGVGVQRWARVAVVGTGLAVTSWWASSWFYHNHPAQAVIAGVIVSIVFAWDQFK